MSSRQSERKIVLVVRHTRLEELVERYNTVSQARFYLEHLGADFSDYELEDARYKRSRKECEEIIASIGRLQILYREYVPNFIFAPDDIVVALGQDGLVANTLKYLDGQKLIGVNPDKSRWDGALLPFTPRTFHKAFGDDSPTKKVTMVKAALSDGQILYGVNDIFIGRKTHVSARYSLTFDGRSEAQSSSGIIVSTGLGSTGWLSSIMAGAYGIVNNSTNAPRAHIDPKFAWDSPFLSFSVREPYPSKTTGADIVYGRLERNKELIIESQMPEGGVIFSDGMENDAAEFLSGNSAKISVADKTGILAV
jgi:NAD kinase